MAWVLTFDSSSTSKSPIPKSPRAPSREPPKFNPTTPSTRRISTISRRPWPSRRRSSRFPSSSTPRRPTVIYVYSRQRRRVVFLVAFFSEEHTQEERSGFLFCFVATASGQLSKIFGIPLGERERDKMGRLSLFVRFFCRSACNNIMFFFGLSGPPCGGLVAGDGNDTPICAIP
jgi:hypothetical protein